MPNTSPLPLLLGEMMETVKICNVCKLEKSLEEFNLHPSGLLGRQPLCRSCKLIKNKQWEKDNPKKARNQDIRYRKRHPEQSKAYANKWARANRPKQRAWILRTKYGITPEQWDELFKSQNGVCAVCKTYPGGRWHTDHNHTTNKVRGILCSRCNHALGLVKENPETLLNMIQYLDKHNT